MKISSKEGEVTEVIMAVVALALREYSSSTMHDTESGRITIAPRQTEWNSHILTMTEWPRMKCASKPSNKR